MCLQSAPLCFRRMRMVPPMAVWCNQVQPATTHDEAQSTIGDRYIQPSAVLNAKHLNRSKDRNSDLVSSHMLFSVPLKRKVMSKQMLLFCWNIFWLRPSLVRLWKKRQPPAQWHLSPKCPEVKRARPSADCSPQARTQITNALSYTCYPVHLHGVELN